MRQGMHAVARGRKRQGNGLPSQSLHKELCLANTMLLTLYDSLHTSDLHNCARINVCRFKPLPLQHLVPAATGNEYRRDERAHSNKHVYSPSHLLTHAVCSIWMTFLHPLYPPSSSSRPSAGKTLLLTPAHSFLSHLRLQTHCLHQAPP